VASLALFYLKGIWLGLAVAVPIGPVNLAIIDRGLRQGFRAAFMVGLGSTVADLVYVLLAYAGADPLSRQAWARVLLFGAGSLVLFWLGGRAVQGAVAPAGGPAGEAASGAAPEGTAVAAAPGTPPAPGAGRGPFVAGALITLLNPVSIASWIGILGAELAGRPRAGVGAELLFVAALCSGLMLWVVALAAALHHGRRFVGGRGLRAATLLAGVSLIGFGAHFALKALEAIGE
jgi:threonine/homoserine/homoserine lactone efflux protein